jgi:hypothetical protein
MKILVEKFLFFLIILIIFLGCKKYPEDIVWFRRPSKQPIVGGYLTKYEVNGIDSLDLLNQYLQAVPHFKNRDIRDCQFEQFINHGIITGTWTLGDLCVLAFTQTISSNGKKVRIKYGDDACIGRDIFLNQEWTILNFPTRHSRGLTITTTVNGNKYEIKIGDK